MQTWNVMVARKSYQTIKVQVRAKTERKAREKALAIVDSIEFGAIEVDFDIFHSWKPNKD